MDPPEPEAQEDAPLLNDDRNAIRSTVFNSLLVLAANSKLYLLFLLLMSLAKITACVVILFLPADPTDKPLATFVIILICTYCVSVFSILYNLLTQPDARSTFSKRFVMVLENLSLL
jgi:hypothetical protein